MLIEICTPTYESAINAQKGGAHRIELCEHLSVGGVTPSKELLRKVKNAVSIRKNVLIRPRGGDFVYSKSEFYQMLKDIDACKSIGYSGIVSGVLNPDNTIDIERTKQLIEASKPISFTFHKAFDETPDALNSLQILIELGVDRILTSGQEATATEGLKTLRKLQKKANGKIIILVGGGLRSHNVKEFALAGFKEVHSSAVVNSEEHSSLVEIQNLVRVSEGY
jgi:copper homeostasis protein